MSNPKPQPNRHVATSKRGDYIFLSTTEAAERLGVSRDSVVRSIHAGELEAYDAGNGKRRCWRVSEKSLRAFIEKRMHRPARQPRVEVPKHVRNWI